MDGQKTKKDGLNKVKVNMDGPSKYVSVQPDREWLIRTGLVLISLGLNWSFTVRFDDKIMPKLRRLKK